HKRLEIIAYLKDYCVYRQDHFDRNPKTGNITRKAIADANNTPFQITKYTYDKNQNPIQEQVGKGKEWRTLTRTFSDDGFNLKLSETDRDGKLTCYTYIPDTNLLASEIVYEESAIRKRTFHFYDDCAVHIKTIIDDGQTADPNDLEGVTLRKITKITPRQKSPCFGLPETVEEKTIDSFGNEKLLKKISYVYHPSGKIHKERHYDANNTHCYTITHTYDGQERLTSTTDPLGFKTTFTYDQNNNLTSISGPRPDQHREITYDKANRPIRIAEWQSDGTILITEKKYDKLGQVIEEIDPCKNRTSYRYDVLGRVISIHHPDGGIELKEYDIVGNLIKEIDPEGHETRKTYNPFSQPLSIYHPDGSEEHFTYHPTGTLRSHTDKNGATTFYTYDIFDHPIKAETYSDSGQLLKTITSTWSAFNKLSETEGNRTTVYTYDYAGRKTDEQTAYQGTGYHYDKLGRLTLIQEGDTSIIEEFDANDRPLQTRTETSGILQTKEEYRYDQAGNQTHRIHASGCTETLFNTQGKPLSIKDPLGFTTHFSYTYHNQLVQTTLDPKGIQTISIYNFRNQEVKRVKKNKNGEVIQRYENSYDKNGNRIQLIHTIFLGNRIIKTIIHLWEYGPGDRLERFIEAGERETRYHYDPKGRLKTLIKPDGTVLEHEYDELGRLARYFSHDFDYYYTYDLNDQVTSVYDKITNRTTTRQYDPLGQIQQETLASGLTLANTYDNRGRRTTLTLPDTTTIHYAYNGAYLYSVTRDSYTHTYTERDLQGKIIHAHLPVGEIEIERDPLSRYSNYIAPYYRANYQNGYDPNGNLVHYTYHDLLGEVDSDYSYDDHDQLIAENEHTYLFDSLHNRLKKDTYDHEVNALCQITNDGQTHYTYDVCGNLIS
ncbi:MAG: hypothetical protein WAM28_00405, partial [Chlamydiales bacterium]